MKTSIQIILIVLVVALSYFLVQSIMKPIRFNEEQQHRYELAISKLKDIRKIEVAYKARYESFTGSFSKLIQFVKTDSFKVVRAIGNVPDSLTEEQALKQGIVTRDTINISVLDSLFSANYPIDSLAFVPFTKNDTFILGAGEIITGSKVKVKVFEAAVPDSVLLRDMDWQLRVNFSDIRLKIAKYPGLRVGSLTEASNNAGNWE